LCRRCGVCNTASTKTQELQNCTPGTIKPKTLVPINTQLQWVLRVLTPTKTIHQRKAYDLIADLILTDASWCHKCLRARTPQSTGSVHSKDPSGRSDICTQDSSPQKRQRST
jgi:hypothetical protein